MGPRFQDRNQEGLVTSLLLLGAFFACPMSGFFADKLGRRLAIIIGCLIFMLGGALQTAAMNIDSMMAGRFFAGMPPALRPADKVDLRFAQEWALVSCPCWHLYTR